MRVVRHKKDAGHVLFRYPYFSSLSDCDEKIVCLSERSIAIILNALEYSDKMRTRVYTEVDQDYYTTVGDDEWGNFQYWVSTVRTELGSWVMCNEYLERIAVALEEANQAADEQTLNLKDVFEAMGISPSESEADILEALEYVLSIPGIDILPDFKIPKLGFISSFMEGRYRAAHLQLLRDQAISQRGMAVAQGGVDFAALYDTMGETADSLIVKAGFAGKAYWIWRWLDNDEIPGWAGWVTTISGLLFGSIRGAIYGILSLMEGWVWPDYTAAIEGISLTCASGSHSASSGCGCTGGSGSATDDQPATGQPSTPGDGPGGYPPPDDWEGTTEEYDEYKCKASNFVYEACYNALNYMAAASAAITAAGGGVAAGSSILTALLGSGAAYTAAGGVMLFAFVPGWVIGAIVAAVAAVAFVAGWAVLEVASWVADEFETGKDDLICKLYNSGTPEEARGHLELALADAVANMVIDAPFSAWEALVRSAYATVIGYFVPNSLINLLFEESDVVNSYSGGSNDCTGCDNTWWNCIFGTPGSVTSTSVIIEAVIAGDGDYSANIGIEGEPESWNITVVSGSVTTPLAVPESVTRWSDLEGAACGVASVDPQWNEVLGVEAVGSYPSITAFALRSSTAFSIQIVRS